MNQPPDPDRTVDDPPGRTVTAFRAPSSTVDKPLSPSEVSEATHTRSAFHSADPRYRLLRFHARGGLGEVFVAEDGELHREVAVKRIREHHAGDPISQQRFLREAEITARLEHPGVVPVHGLVLDAEGRPCYAMRFIQGETLDAAIRRFHTHDAGSGDAGERRLELRELLTRFVAVCQTLAFAHSQGVIHRDLKPSNIMLGSFGETLVVDWGLAKQVGRTDNVNAAEQKELTSVAADDSESLTATGATVGTIAYMSPEQATGQLDLIGPACDIYSLGATLYCLLTGHAPFHGTDKGMLFRRVQAGGCPPARKVNPHVPAALEAICMKAMARKAQDRYASPLALADDLEHWLADEPFATYREPWRQRLGRRLRRHRTAVTAIVVALLLISAAAVGGLYLWNAVEHRRQSQAHEYMVNLRVSAETNEEMALTEVRAGRFLSADNILKHACELLQDEPQLAELRVRLESRKDRVHRLVRFYELSAEVQRLSFYEQLQEAQASAEQALAALEVFAHEEWWAKLPDAELTPAQRADLRNEAYRQLLIVAGLRALHGGATFATAQGRSEIRAALQVADLAERFRSSRSGRLLKYLCRIALGETVKLQPPPPGQPDSAVDCYFLGIAHVALDSRKDHPVAQLLLRRLGPVGSELDLKTPLATAEKYLRQAAILEPRHYFTHLFLSEALRLNHQAAAAELAVNTCIGLQPEDGIGYEIRAVALRVQFRQASEPTRKKQLFDRAVSDYTRAIQLNPASYRAFTLRGMTYYDYGQYDQAIADYSAALRLAPRDSAVSRKKAHTHSQRAESYMEKGAYDKAILDFSEQLQLDPNNAGAYHRRGDAHFAKQEYDAAIVDFGEAIRLDPTGLDHYSCRADSYLKKSEYDKAIADYSSQIRLVPTSDAAYKRRGNARVLKGDHDAAIADLSEAIRLNPHASDYYDNRGKAYRAKGKYELALADFSNAIKLNGANPWFWYERGYLYAELRQWSNAAAELGKAVELCPNDTFFRRLYADLLVRAADLETYRRACRRMIKELGQTKQGAEAGNLSVACSQAQLPKDLAERALRLGNEAVNANPEAWCRFGLASTCYRVGQFQKAIEHAQESLRIWPDWQSRRLNWPILAMAHYRLGNVKEARQ